MSQQKTVLLAGGGTMGSVSPLLALVPALREAGYDLHWAGTAAGPERQFVEELEILFDTVPVAKLHRFLTLRNLWFPAAFVLAMNKALTIINRTRPDVIVSAGGYTAVPLVWLGWLFRIPSVIHQQDLQPTMSNRMMAPVAKAITVAFEKSVTDFDGKAECIGNPVRDLAPTTDSINLDSSVPTVLIFGGGTGALVVNQLVTERICAFANVIHITGGRVSGMEPINHERYHQYEILGEEMKEALQKADLVVARAGIGTMSELAALGKAAIIIPMPGTHQEENTAFLEEHNAALVLDQRKETPESFAEHIQEMLDESTAQRYGAAMASLNSGDAAGRLVERINSLLL